MVYGSAIGPRWLLDGKTNVSKKILSTTVRKTIKLVLQRQKYKSHELEVSYIESAIVKAILKSVSILQIISKFKS